MVLRRILLVVFCLGVLSCSKIDDSKPENVKTIGEKILVKINMPDDVTTKILYKDDKVGSEESSLLWEVGDKVAIVGMSGNTYQKNELTLAAGGGTKNATFSGDGITGVNEYFVYYPSNVAVDANNGAGSLNFEGQTQSGNNNSEHLRDYIYLASDNKVDINGDSFTLNIKSCIAKFVLENIPTDIGNINKLIWSVETTNGTKSMVLKFDNGKPIIIDNTNSSLTAYISFMPSEMSIKEGGKYTVELIGNTKTYMAEKTSLTGKRYIAGKRYTASLNKFSAVSIPYYNYRYGYDKLSEEDKKVYDHIKNKILDFDNYKPHTYSTQSRAMLDFSEINMQSLNANTTVNFDRIKRILRNIIDDMPEILMVGSEIPRFDDKTNKLWYVRINNSYINTYNADIASVNTRVDEICAGAKNLKTDFEKFKHIHDTFLPITYSPSNNANGIIGGFIEKKAVCEGFSRSILYLCQRIGIKAIYITGSVNRGGSTITHAWNYVCIDGKWYLLDATDDNGMAGSTKENYSKFLLGKNAVEGEYPLSCYEYNLPTLEDNNCPGSDDLRK